MSQSPKRFLSLAIMLIIVSGCQIGGMDAQAEAQTAPTTVTYETLLGKPIHDRAVADFLVTDGCSRAAQFLLCKAAGLALTIDADQVVDTVYLYLNNADGFTPYQGELPFGLKFYDTMGAVEYKFTKQGIGSGGLPDSAATPDHMHYRATYNEAGLTILYNSPFADEDATIYAILLSK